MSSYLTLYGVPKEGGNPISFYCVSRNHPIYQAINDTLNPVFYYGKDGKTNYSELTSQDVQEVINDLQNELKNCDARLEVLKENANGNLEVINEILDYKQLRDELACTINQMDFISIIVEDCKRDYTNGFTKILMNVD